LKHFRQADISKHLFQRATVISAIRRFFVQSGYLEVETPLRIPAPAPETHLDAQGSGNWYLQTSPELCMKRLLAVGYDRIFQICKCFRKGERGRYHLPEFTLLEWYAANTDYRDMMVQTEALIRHVARQTGLNGKIHFKCHVVDLEKTWQRISVQEAFKQYAAVSLEEAMAGDVFEDVLTAEVEPFLGISSPVFLCDYPAEMAALARLKHEDPRYAERFELYIGGVEICNAFSELTDPEEQRKRFEKDNRTRKSMGKEVYPEALPFLEALAAMPEASGNALGVDRLVMVLGNHDDIKSVTAFTPEEL
jgi:elongation factor P--(R)-beta-lysine ligase